MRKTLHHLAILTLFLLFSNTLMAQNGVGINTDNSNPDPSAMLDVKSTTQGVLVPRMLAAEKTAIPVPATGLLIFQTDGAAGFWYYDGSAWQPISGGANGWELDGNAGTISGTNFIGTTDAQNLSFRTNNILRTRITQKGQIEVMNTGGSVFLGENAGTNDDLSNNRNVFIGVNAGALATTANQNTAIGGFSLFNNVAGLGNTAIGYSSLISNTANYNTAVGHNALQANTSGQVNTAFGAAALYLNTTGANNNAFGNNALFDNTTGGSNASFGNFSLQNNTTGNNNVAFGVLSLDQNIVGSNNTALGYFAGSNALGSGNVFLGHEAGYNEVGSDKLYIANSNTATPLIYGDFATNLLRVNGTLNVNNAYSLPTADGTINQVLTTDGAGNVAWAAAAGGGSTLDGAYDFGGAGLGRNITADAGVVAIDGLDGFLTTGTFGSGLAIGAANGIPEGAGTRMFFNPAKAAFRAGGALGTQWDNANVGNYSTAMGRSTTASSWFTTAIGNGTTASGNASTAMGNGTTASGGNSTAMGGFTTASGTYSTAMGGNTTASGVYSTAMGIQTTASGYNSAAMGRQTTASGDYATTMGYETTAPSYGETTIGLNSTSYVPLDLSSFNAADRLFTIGNGASAAARSNALTVYKDGRININDAYTLPTADGTVNQVLTTDGTGNVSWAAAGGGSLWTDLGTEVRPTTNENVRSGGDFIAAAGNGVINCGGSLNANANVIGDVATPTITIATGDEDLWIQDDLEVTSQAYKPGGGTWVAISDQRLKKDIKPFSDGLSKLMQINPVTFKYNDKLPQIDQDKDYVGVIAQDIEKVAPYMVEKKNFFEVVTENENGEEVVIKQGEEFLTYDANAMTYILVNAVKEQQTTIQTLETKVADLESELSEMKAIKAELAEIKALLKSNANK